MTAINAAPDVPTFIAAITQAYIDAMATDFPGRAKAIAGEIAATEPHFVGLQEATLWRTGPHSDPAPAEKVEANFVQLILDELDGTYEVVAAQTGFDAETPSGAGVDVRLTIQDVLLVRTGLPPSDLALSSEQTGIFAHRLMLNSPVGKLPFPRQWVAVDAKMRGKEFRVITTHLEPAERSVRVAQAQELLSGPASTTLPTILIGDINAQPSDVGDAAATLISAVFTDIWPVVRPTDSGFTCCQAVDLRNPVSTVDQRIDLVLMRNGPEVVHAQLVGDSPINLAPSGVRWSSDHSGVMAAIELP